MENIKLNKSFIFLFICFSLLNSCNSSYEDLLKEGNKLDNNGAFNKALIVYDKAIKKWPQNGEAYYRKGLTYLKLNDTLNALNIFMKTLDLKYTQADLTYILGSIYSNKGEINKAIKFYSKSIEQGNEKANVFNERGILYYKEKQYNIAVQDFTQAINLDKFDLSINLNIVIEEWRYLKKDRESLEKFIIPFYYRAKAKEYVNDYYGALLDYDMVIKLNPTYAEVYFNRGIIKFKLGDYKGACIDWSSANEYGYEEAIKLIHENCNKKYN